MAWGDEGSECPPGDFPPLLVREAGDSSTQHQNSSESNQIWKTTPFLDGEVVDIHIVSNLACFAQAINLTSFPPKNQT